jgi:hypothetical protein
MKGKVKPHSFGIGKPGGSNAMTPNILKIPRRFAGGGACHRVMMSIKSFKVFIKCDLQGNTSFCKNKTHSINECNLQPACGTCLQIATFISRKTKGFLREIYLAGIQLKDVTIWARAVTIFSSSDWIDGATGGFSVIRATVSTEAWRTRMRGKNLETRKSRQVMKSTNINI